MPLDTEDKGNDMDYWSNDNPKCPWCDYVIEIDKHELYELYDDNDNHYIDCPSCEKELRVSTRAVYTFSTDEQDDLEVIEKQEGV